MHVLLEPAVAHFGEPNTRLMTPIGCSTLARTFDLVRFLARLAWSTRPRWRLAAVGEIRRSRRLLADHGTLAAIGLIALHPGLPAVQQFGQHPAVGDIGRRRHRHMDQLDAAVDAQMRLHAELPLIALLRLMHLGITGLVGNLGRERRGDDRRIDNCAGGHLQSLRRQVPLDLVEQPLAQIVRYPYPRARRGDYRPAAPNPGLSTLDACESCGKLSHISRSG